MKPKTLKITYWVVVSLFCLANFASGIAELMPPSEQAMAMITMLGYPLYFYMILGASKILGSIAVIQTKYKTIKEWANAGFAIDYISASLSFAFVKGPMFAIAFPLIFLAVLFWAYFLGKKVDMLKS